MCFESRIFFKHICYCVKYKRTCRLFVKMLMDSYDETKVKQAFLILETESEWGLLDKTIRCFIGSNVQEINFVAG